MWQGTATLFNIILLLTCRIKEIDFWTHDRDDMITLQFSLCPHKDDPEFTSELLYHYLALPKRLLGAATNILWTKWLPCLFEIVTALFFECTIHIFGKNISKCWLKKEVTFFLHMVSDPHPFITHWHSHFFKRGREVHDCVHQQPGRKSEDGHF